MSDKIDDGGPAFPAPYDDHHDHKGGSYGTSGLSMRDWFAGQIIGHLYAVTTGPEFQNTTIRGIASEAYEVADAMLAARKGGEV